MFLNPEIIVKYQQYTERFSVRIATSNYRTELAKSMYFLSRYSTKGLLHSKVL